MTVISTHCPRYSNIYQPKNLDYQDKMTEIAGCSASEQPKLPEHSNPRYQ